MEFKTKCPKCGKDWKVSKLVRQRTAPGEYITDGVTIYATDDKEGIMYDPNGTKCKECGELLDI